MRLTTRSCRLGGTISARMKRWRSSGSTVGCAIGLPAFGDEPVWCRKRSTWSTPPSHCLPPTTSIEQRQNSPCHCLLNTLCYWMSYICIAQLCSACNAQGRGGRPYDVGHIGLGQVGVVFLCDPCIGMSQLLGDHLKRDALHGQSAGVGVAQHVEADGRNDASR